MAVLSAGTRRLIDRLGGPPRRVAAAICAALALLIALAGPGSADPEPTRAVLTAARDLPAGLLLEEADLRIEHWPRSVAPAAAIESPPDAVGHRTGGPIGEGEALSESRLADAGLGQYLRDGRVAIAVDVGSGAGWLRAGDVVDVYAGPAEGLDIGPDAGAGEDGRAPAARIAAGAVVLAALPGDGVAGAEAVLEVDPATAAQLAASAGRTLTAVIVKPG
jgi:Flp pilus assembly protein CpaB